jgi:hypothetical protein
MKVDIYYEWSVKIYWNSLAGILLIFKETTIYNSHNNGVWYEY